VSWSVPLTTLDVPEEDVQAVLDCLESGWLTMGPRTQAFEAALAERLGVEHVVAVSSGTAALHLTCLAVGLGPGDEMIVPGLTFIASASAARFCGAEPVLCEIVGPRDLNIDVDDVRARIGERTKAVMAVHFCGYPAAVEALRAICDEHDLVLIEDCAQAITTIVDGGRLAGTVGHAGCLSFFSKKQLCVGEGGAVITDDEAIATKVRSLRSHAMTSVTWDRHRGHAESYDVVDIGFNYRIDEPRAALGLSRLARLDEDIEGRREVARAYRRGLAGTAGLELAWSDEQVERSSHFAFPVLLPDMAERDEFRARLKADGVQTTWYPPLSDFFTYREAYPDLSLPRTEEAAFRHCALPISAGMSADDVQTVIAAARAARD
jgi:dTDP-4-amino-4,6-dideoxygalactose transaminase